MPACSANRPSPSGPAPVNASVARRSPSARSVTSQRDRSASRSVANSSSEVSRVGWRASVSSSRANSPALSGSPADRCASLARAMASPRNRSSAAAWPAEYSR